MSIIPHTAKETTLSLKRCGDVVNLENDIVGKYIEVSCSAGRRTADGNHKRVPAKEWILKYQRERKVKENVRV